MILSQSHVLIYFILTALLNQYHHDLHLQKRYWSTVFLRSHSWQVIESNHTRYSTNRCKVTLISHITIVIKLVRSQIISIFLKSLDNLSVTWSLWVQNPYPKTKQLHNPRVIFKRELFHPEIMNQIILNEYVCLLNVYHVSTGSILIVL